MGDKYFPLYGPTDTPGLLEYPAAAADSVRSILRIRDETDAAGLYVWTFDPPFAEDVIPVISATVEEATVGTVATAQITDLDNEQVTIQVNKISEVLGVLTLAPVPGVTYLHLTATPP